MAAIPFGFGVGDFFAVGSIALKLYYAYKEIPSNFKSLCDELFKVSVTLNELEKDSKDPNSLFRHFRDSRKKSLKKTISHIQKELLKLKEFREKNIGIATGDRLKRIKQMLKADFSEKKKVLQDCMEEIKLYKAEAATASILSFDSSLLGLEKGQERLRQEIAKAQEQQTRDMNQKFAMMSQVMEQITRSNTDQFLKPPNSAMILSPKRHRSARETEQQVDGIINAIGNNTRNGIRKEELEENREFIRALVKFKDESANPLHLDTSSCKATRSASPTTPVTPLTPLSDTSLMDYIEEKQDQERRSRSRSTTPLPEFRIHDPMLEDENEEELRPRAITPALSDVSLMDYIREKQEEERTKPSPQIASKQKQEEEEPKQTPQAKSEQKQGLAYIHERREQERAKGKDWMTEEPKQGVTRKRTWELMEEKAAAVEEPSDGYSKRRRDTINMTLRPKPPQRKNSMADYAKNQKKEEDMLKKREQETRMKRQEDTHKKSEDNTRKTRVEYASKKREEDTRKKKAWEEEPKIGVTRKRTLDVAEVESDKVMHVEPGQRKKASAKSRKHKVHDEVIEVQVGFKFVGKLLIGKSVNDIVDGEIEKVERNRRRWA